MRTIVFLPMTSRDQTPNTRSVGRIVQVMKTRGNHDGTYRSTHSRHTIEDKASKPLSSTRIQVGNKPGKTSLRRHADHTPCSRQRRGTFDIPFRPRSNDSRKNTSEQTNVHLSWKLSPRRTSVLPHVDRTDVLKIPGTIRRQSRARSSVGTCILRINFLSVTHPTTLYPRRKVTAKTRSINTSKRSTTKPSYEADDYRRNR